MSRLCCNSAFLMPPFSLQVNNAAAQRLFAGQLHVKMHMQQKGGGSGGGKAKAARTSKKAAGDGGAAAAAAAAGGGEQASGRGAVGAGGYQQHQQQHAAQQQYQQLEDPIDLCDDDDEEDGSNSLRVTVVMKALMDLNAFLRKQRGVGRAPFQTVALQRVRVSGGRGARCFRWTNASKAVQLAAPLRAQASDCPTACH